MGLPGVLPLRFFAKGAQVFEIKGLGLSAQDFYTKSVTSASRENSAVRADTIEVHVSALLKMRQFTRTEELV